MLQEYPRELVDELLADALELETPRRGEFLAQAGADYPDLLSELQSLVLQAAATGPLDSTVPAPRFEPGEVVGARFRITSYIASGGMGDVYAAEDLELSGLPVALKVLKPEIAAQPSMHLRFRQEIRIGKLITHQHICRVYDLGFFTASTNDATAAARCRSLFMTMELLSPATTLSRLLLASGPPELSYCERISRQIGEAVGALHARGYIHRDLKSSNIMLVHSESVSTLRAVVTDLGLARSLAYRTYTKTCDFQTGRSGTPAYMAPEQVFGGELTERTDVYALGVVLYQLISGQLPRGAAGCRSNDVPPPLSRHRPDLPGRWQDAISKALDLNPANRFASVREFVEALHPGPEPVGSARLDDVEGVHISRQRAFGLSRRMRLFAVVATIVLCIVAATTFMVHHASVRSVISTHTTRSTSYKEYLEASQLIDHGGPPEYLDRAISLYRKCVDADPLFALAYARLGQAYLLKYRLTQDSSLLRPARENSERALQLDSKLSIPYVTLGILDDGSKQHELAIQEFQQALDADPRSTDAYQGLARAYDSLGRTKDAEEMLRKAIDLSPNSWRGHDRLGAFYFAHNRLDEAIHEFRRVVKLTPENPLSYSNLGAALLDANRTQEAIETLQKSLQLAPSYSALSNLGTAYYRAGNLSEAARAYEKALRLNDKDFNVLANVALCYRRLQGFDSITRAAYLRAVRATEAYVDANARDIEAIGVLANLKVWLGDAEEAEERATQALTLAPDNPDAELSAASVFAHDGNRGKAVALVVSALKHGARKDAVKNDPDLLELAKDPQIQTILESRANN